MNCPATLIRTTDGKTHKVGPFTVGQVMSLVAPGRFEGISASLPGLHASTHQNGGTDQINVAGLSGLLATPQTPAAHIHPESDVTGLVTDLAALTAADALRALLTDPRFGGPAGTVCRSISADLTISAKYSFMVTGDLEILAGVAFELAADANAEIA